MTTSRLCSTRRLAFSSTISVTWTWRLAGSSKVDEITSPFTVRCMSVTSSGRSRSEEHTSELQSLMRISYAVFCLKKKNNIIYTYIHVHLVKPTTTTSISNNNRTNKE